MKKQDSFLQFMEFHINARVRKICDFKKSLFASTGNVVITNITDVHNFVALFNSAIKARKFDTEKENISYLKAGLLNGMGLLDEIFHYVCRLYRLNHNKSFFQDSYKLLNSKLSKKTNNPNALFELLLEFITEFPPEPVYQGEKDVQSWLSETEPLSNVPNTLIALEELLLLRLANENPAFEPFFVLFNDETLRNNKGYSLFWRSFKQFSAEQIPFGPEKCDLISMLKKPVEYAPYSIKGQLQYIVDNWNNFLGEWLQALLSGLDLIAEEERQGWVQGQNQGETSVYNFENIMEEYERFTSDWDWMPNVVLMAKSTLVWLNQLSKKYSKDISKLTDIPEEELAFLARSGFNALWLIGIWERSNASRRIKQLCGNPEAASSAYSLNSYEISEQLGGWQALLTLRQRCERHGIRLAADMVPNHTGMDSRWVVERPELFLQTREVPFPSYSFTGENLSHDSRVEVYLEDHYYSREDCAVVFKRRDRATGNETYIYHGNDGTGLPWNDTAQLDFLNPATREAVIQEIINVARNFRIIRLDAAMVLAKKHIQRLWYPQPGKGGTIATRSRFALTNEQFNEKIPVEFWREVVDRCNKEIPDTLLLAEAFWMMEGYFVRTLGMHRVYNSAFMNMLKREENEKYRMTIKNTLSFDREVLKRYVNFMNNPDEDTAIAQFGTGDKYFGVCTMMITMPGLPMFGHGQIEGFQEKYGMEYQRAYYDESPNQDLVDRHKREIFPLLRHRSYFSGVENFFLFDFWNNGLVNENVFAWSNYSQGHRSLIFYNNVYERASGWILLSAGYAVKQENGEKAIEQKSLVAALKLTQEENYFTILHEQRSNQYYIRENLQLARSGFYASLEGFQCQVFWEIYEVKDTETNAYRTLCEKLNGAPCENIEEYIREQELAFLHEALLTVLSKEYFKTLMLLSKPLEGLDQAISQIDGSKNKTKPVTLERQAKKELAFQKELLLNFVKSLKQQLSLAVAKGLIPKGKSSVDEERLAKRLFMVMVRFFDIINGTFIENEKLSSNELEWLCLIKKTFATSSEDILTFGSSLALSSVPFILQEAEISYSEAELCSYWLFDKKAAEQVNSFATEFKADTNETLFKLKTICSLLPSTSAKLTTAEKLTSLVKKVSSESQLQSALQINEWQGELYFNKEQGEYLALLVPFFALVTGVGQMETSAARLKALKESQEIYTRLSKAIDASGYKVKTLQENFT